MGLSALFEKYSVLIGWLMMGLPVVGWGVWTHGFWFMLMGLWMLLEAFVVTVYFVVAFLAAFGFFCNSKDDCLY